jgi:hypothetical protein
VRLPQVPRGGLASQPAAKKTARRLTPSGREARRAPTPKRRGPSINRRVAQLPPHPQASHRQPSETDPYHRCVISGLEVWDRSTLVSGMSRTTSKGERTTSKGEPIALAMTTDDQARARRRVKELNERRRSDAFRREGRELADGRFEVVALAKG